MKLTPAIKGQLTKAVNSLSADNASYGHAMFAIRRIFSRHMPSQQAKHAARNYIAANFSQFFVRA